MLDDARGQGISKHDIDLVVMIYSRLSDYNIDTYMRYQQCHIYNDVGLLYSGLPVTVYTTHLGVPTLITATWLFHMISFGSLLNIMGHSAKLMLSASV